MTDGIGWDFSIFWEIGRAILSGTNPYAVAFSRYPPATTFLFAGFALLPVGVAYLLWSGVNVVLYLHGLRRLGLGRRALGWLLFTPFLFNLLAGQVDVVFWWAALYLAQTPAGAESRKGKWQVWRPALAAAFLTLKPQLAVILLPWFLIRWLQTDRRLLLRWAGLCVVVHLLPLWYDPQIYARWLAALQGVSEMKMAVSAGIFAFSLWNVPVAVLAGLGLVLMVAGWFMSEPAARAAQLCGFPLTIWYDDVLLAGAGPARLLVPLSWLAFVGAALAQNSLPLVGIPVGALGWQLWAWRKRLSES